MFPGCCVYADCSLHIPLADIFVVQPKSPTTSVPASLFTVESVLGCVCQACFVNNQASAICVAWAS